MFNVYYYVPSVQGVNKWTSLCMVKIVRCLGSRHSQKNRSRLRVGEWVRGVYTRNMQKKRGKGGTKEQ